MITISTEESMVKGNVALVGGLTGGGGGWTVDNRVAGDLWDGDLLPGTVGIGVDKARYCVFLCYVINTVGMVSSGL
jgi:hypothetical protein